MGSPSNAVVMKRGPSLLQGLTTPMWQASVKGAQARWLNSPLVYKRAWPCWPTIAPYGWSLSRISVTKSVDDPTSFTLVGS